MSGGDMTDADRIALLTSYEHSYCPTHERDGEHGQHPKCQHCRFREVK